jgi:hypothetical protein
MRFAEALFECTQLAFLNPKGSAFCHDVEAQDDVQVLLHTLSDGCVAVRAPSARPSPDQHTTCGAIVCRRRTGRPFSRGQTPASQKRSPCSSNANGNDRAQTPKKERTEIREAIWSAVSEEVSREVMGRTRPNDGIGKGKGNNSPSDDQSEQKGKSEAARLKQAALQSQQARQNQMASEARKNAKAQGNKLLIPLGTVVPGRTGVPR